MTVTAEQQQRAASRASKNTRCCWLQSRDAAAAAGGRRGLGSRVNLAQRLDGSCGQEISEFCWANEASRTQSSRQCVTA